MGRQVLLYELLDCLPIEPEDSKMSLFGDLPPPSAHLRPKTGAIEDEYKPKPVSENGPEPTGDPEDDGSRPDKRQRVEAQNAGGLSDEQVAAALTKIGAHISNPDKFSKASGLLRQLLDSGALTRANRDQLFDVVKAAFSDFDNASEASLRRDFMKLCHSLDKRADALFSRAQRSQLEVYRIVGFLQNEMHTDDSFVFNKVLARIKEAVAALPPAAEEDEEALSELQAAGESSSGGSSDDEEEEEKEDRGTGRGDPGRGALQAGGSSPRRNQVSEGRAGEGSGQGTAGPAPDPASSDPPPAPADNDPADNEPEPGPGLNDDEADPFGLDQLLPSAPKRSAPRPPPPPPPPPPPAEPATHGLPSADRAQGGGGRGKAGRGRGRGAAWTAPQALVMRRQALIECLITARGFHKTPWARTSVELLVEHFAQHRDRFTGEQRVAVDEMVRFVRAARQARPTGPSQKEINRDTTSFERARAEWSRATLSARGKVGASGDAKSNNWLG